MVKRTKKQPARIRKSLEERTKIQIKHIVFSLKDFDINQGQSFEEWEKNKLLANLMARLREISSNTVIEAINKGILKEYGEFPENTEFRFPIYLFKGVNWASLHIAGKQRVAGYIEDNVFYIVFLDKDHKFWISEKKHT
jgi:hypothetical protein